MNSVTEVRLHCRAWPHICGYCKILGFITITGNLLHSFLIQCRYCCTRYVLCRMYILWSIVATKCWNPSFSVVQIGRIFLKYNMSWFQEVLWYFRSSGPLVFQEVLWYFWALLNNSRMDDWAYNDKHAFLSFSFPLAFCGCMSWVHCAGWWTLKRECRLECPHH